MDGKHGAVKVVNRSCFGLRKLSGFEILIVFCLIGFLPKFVTGLWGLLLASGIVPNVLEELLKLFKRHFHSGSKAI